MGDPRRLQRRSVFIRRLVFWYLSHSDHSPSGTSETKVRNELLRFSRQRRNCSPLARYAGAGAVSACGGSFRRRGAGKYTLALMLAQALNCLTPTETGGLPDFLRAMRELPAHCAGRRSRCAVCRSGGDARRAARGRQKDTRLFVQTHPDVLIIPPDPPQMMIKVDQVRG